MTMDSVVPSSLIFQIHKGPRGEHTTRDSHAEIWPATSNSLLLDGGHADGPCQVCQTHKARYTCPRCSIQYCSSDCYKNHNGNALNCTESFYQDRVSRVTSLENSAKQEDFHRLLRRAYSQQLSDCTNEADILGNETIYDHKELLELLDLLDKGNEREVSKLLQRKPDWRTAVDSSLRRGELSDWLLEPWAPWWRVQLSGSPYLELDETPLLSNEGDKELLDERLLKVPSYSVLRPNRLPTPPQLAFNILEILLATISTLRLFHGCSNAKLASVDATQFLIETSLVLMRDVRFQTIQEALLVFSGTLANQSFPSKSSLSVYAFEDLAIIIGNRRLVAKALFEATDILAAALRDSIDKTYKKTIKRCLRKIEFFLSWSLDSELASFDYFADQIHEWLADRKSAPCTGLSPDANR